MLSIENLRLKIDERGGRTTAVVTYQLKGPDTKVGERTRYVEVVHLMGVDAAPREDGIDDSIPHGMAVDVLLLPLADPNRIHIFNLEPGDLDEDRHPSPNAGFPLEDEIVARVSLRPAIVPLVVDSNIVTRGGLVNKIGAVPA